MKNFQNKLVALNKTIDDMFEHGMQILDPDDSNYRLAGVFCNSEKGKAYFIIALAEEEEEEE